MSSDLPGPPDSYPGYDWVEAEAEEYSELIEKLRHFDEARMFTYLQLLNIMEGHGGETKQDALQQLEAMAAQTAQAFSALGSVAIEDCGGNVETAIQMLTTIYSTDEQERVNLVQKLNPNEVCLMLEDSSIKRSIDRCFMTVLGEYDSALHTPEDIAYDLEQFYLLNIEEDFTKCTSVAPNNTIEDRNCEVLASRKHWQSVALTLGKVAAGSLAGFAIARKFLK